MIVEMTLAHALHVCSRMRESDAQALAAISPGMTAEQFAIDRFASDFRFCILAADGEPVVIGGARMSAARVATCWMVATDRMDEVRRELIRFCAKFARGLLARGVARRLEAYVLFGTTATQACRRFAVHFGLIPEGIRRGAGAGGEDVEMFGLLRST